MATLKPEYKYNVLNSPKVTL